MYLAMLKAAVLGGLLEHTSSSASAWPCESCPLFCFTSQGIADTLVMNIFALDLISQIPTERKLLHDPKDRDLSQRTEG